MNSISTNVRISISRPPSQIKLPRLKRLSTEESASPVILQQINSQLHSNKDKNASHLKLRVLSCPQKISHKNEKQNFQSKILWKKWSLKIPISQKRASKPQEKSISIKKIKQKISSNYSKTKKKKVNTVHLQVLKKNQSNAKKLQSTINEMIALEEQKINRYFEELKTKLNLS